MSSLAAARADNFYIPNNFDPNKPSRKAIPDHLKKDYSTIRFFIKNIDLRLCFILSVNNVIK